MPIKNNLCYSVYFLLLLVFLLQSFYYPNFILSEEHHYLEVASHWYDHPNQKVLKDTMGFYLSKPPLLFWILSISWKILGAHNWVVHFILMSTLAAIFYCSQYLYKILFNNEGQAQLVPVIILGSFLFFSRSTVFCFDSLVVLFFVLSAIGVVWALKHHYIRGFILYGFAVGLGLLTKGPIILAFCLPFFIVATFLRRNYGVRDRAWFFGFILSVLIIAVLLMMWLAPLFYHLSSVQQHMLLFHRGFGMGDTYGRAPFYFYIKTCFLLFLPWLLWPFGVQSLFFSIRKNDNTAFRLIFYSLLLSLIILSIIPPKALRYVMSSMSLFAILYTYALFQNKVAFNNSTRGLLILLTSIALVMEVVTLLFSEWVMAKISYPAITYSWVLIFENLIIASGILLISLKKRATECEAMRLFGFMCVLVMSTIIFPHEVLSQHFNYQSFVNYLNEVNKKNIPIIYCRAYGGYQYSMTTPPLPKAKYTLKPQEAEKSTYVYFVEEIKKSWPAQSDYVYRLVDPGQTSAIFIKKIPADEVVGLSFKQQQCIY